MNALDLIHELSSHGVRVEVHGDRLNLEGPTDVLTDDMAERLRQHKPELLSLYGRRVHGIPIAELRERAGADWPELEADSNLLEAFAVAVQARHLRESGQIPAGWTETVICAGCGPVPLWPGLPRKVLACPWCFNRVRGLPVPHATSTRADDGNEGREANR